MTKLQVLMPMGGLGSRFTREGYTIPKPLIGVDGKPMFMRALDSFAGIDDVTYIFVIRSEHIERYDIASKIKQQIPEAKISILDHDTDGAVESCLVAEEHIDDHAPISVADCDIYFESEDYFAKALSDTPPKGMLLTFESTDPRYSYVKVDENGTATETAEKIAISNHAILGGYFFSSGLLFKKLAHQFVDAPLPDGLKEYYMSHLFNILLKGGDQVQIAPVDKKYIFGTPEELMLYLDGKQ